MAANTAARVAQRTKIRWQRSPLLQTTCPRERTKENSTAAEPPQLQKTYPSPPTHTQTTKDKTKPGKYFCSKDSDAGQKMLVETLRQLQDPTPSQHSAAGTGGSGWENVQREGLTPPQQKEVAAVKVLRNSPKPRENKKAIALCRLTAVDKRQTKPQMIPKHRRCCEICSEAVWIVKCSFSGCDSETLPRQTLRSMDRSPILYF